MINLNLISELILNEESIWVTRKKIEKEKISYPLWIQEELKGIEDNL